MSYDGKIVQWDSRLLALGQKQQPEQIREEEAPVDTPAQDSPVFGRTILVNIRQDVLEMLDAEVAKRTVVWRQRYLPTPQDLNKAKEIARANGVGEANKYLKDLQKSKGQKPSRTALINELLMKELA